jgi:GNAT superfamily N-acetyltransferase
MTPSRLAWRVEETCLNAWPALQQVLAGGWVMRFSEGLTRRANSVNPLCAARDGIDTLIPACEALYRRHRLPTIFRVPSIIEPGLDERLEALGYSREGESYVLYGRLDATGAAKDPQVRLLSRPTPEWFAAMARLQNHTTVQRRIYRRIVAAIAVPAAFAVLLVDGEFAALAYGVIHDRLLCYESVITDPRRQRHGYARRIVASLAAWAQENGAEAACLQVEARNAPALALYRAVGLRTELYRYHYRRQAQSAARL